MRRKSDKGLSTVSFSAAGAPFFAIYDNPVSLRDAYEDFSISPCVQLALTYRYHPVRPQLTLLATKQLRKGIRLEGLSFFFLQLVKGDEAEFNQGLEGSACENECEDSISNLSLGGAAVLNVSAFRVAWDMLLLTYW